ncbi:CHAT domain-containing protein [Nocardia sp. NPDC049149]|uniref:CHAT domain-containing tetratricopeptide repeat protein n=1 Tax=Nocardia sp. NPDC049149 TaxID=3364315 RepID=UPI0037151EA4
MRSRDSQIAELHAILQDSLDRVANVQDPAPVMEARVYRAAQRLADLLGAENDPAELPSRWLLGWVYWHRARGSTGDEASAELEEAVHMHAYCLAAGYGPLPEELLGRIADAMVPQASQVLAEAMQAREEFAVQVAAIVWGQIVEATAREDVRWPQRSANAGLAAFVRFESYGQRDDLDRAEAYLRAALDADDSADVVTLLNLGNVLTTRVQFDPEHADLDEPITVLRRAAGLADSGEVRAACAGALTTALRIRFERTGDPVSLDEAICAGTDAVAMVTSEHPSHAEYTSNLAAAILRRYDLSGDMTDVDHAIELFRESTIAIAEENPRRTTSLSNLGIALAKRYRLTGATDDLDEAIEAGWAAVNYLDSEPHGVGRLEALAAALHTRYESSRAAADLDDLRTIHSALVAVLPDDHPERPRRLLQLAAVYHDRFQRDQALDDLDRAILQCEQAVDEFPLDSPGRSHAVRLLGSLLLERYHRIGDPGDLERSIELLRSTTDTASAEPVAWTRGVASLVEALFERFHGTGDQGDLDESIRLVRAAAGTEDDFESMSLATSLSAVLRARFQLCGDPADLDEAIDYAERVLRSNTNESDTAALEFNLGSALASRHRLSGSTHDRDCALTVLESVAVQADHDLTLRIQAAHASGVLLAREDPGRAAQLLAFAVHLLDNLAPRHLEAADQQRQLHDVGAVAADAAAFALQDPGRPVEARAGQALELIEAGRAILFGQGIEMRSDTRELAAQHPDLAEQLDALRHTLRWMREGSPRGLYMLGDFPDPTLRSFPDAVRERRTLGERYVALLDEIRSRPGFTHFAKAAPDIDIPALELPGAVVVFNISEFRSDAMLVNKGTVSHVSLPTLTIDAVADQVAAFDQALRDAADPTSTSARRAAAQRTFSQILQWLWHHAAGPVLEALGHHAPPEPGQPWPRIWWAPGGLLGNLPIHAAGHHNSDPGARAVLDRVISSYTPTLRALTYARQRMRVPRHDTRALIVSMPTTPGIPGRLHFVPEEVDSIKQYLNTPWILHEPETDSAETDLVMPYGIDELLDLADSGSDLPRQVPPTASAVLTFLPACTLVHFACHAYRHPTEPALSALLLHDEALTVGAIATTYPQYADLAYLSACQTAQSPDDQLADEGINLVSAFQLAGYTNVIGTLWEVNDDIAATIAANLYQRITTPDGNLDTTSTAEVLHHVIRDIRRAKTATPTLWAAHIHAGA